MNFRHILSKSSLKSSSSLGKNLTHSEEIIKLQNEIDSLKLTLDSLKISLESRDAAIGTLAREKEKLYVELKRTQRTNRNLHQQLIDERDIHSKEKEYLIEEIKKFKKLDCKGTINSHSNIFPHEDQSEILKSEIKAKDEIIYNICSKYLKLKSNKMLLHERFEKLQYQIQKTCENIILHLQENRYAINSVLNKLIKSLTISSSCRRYLQLLKINANLHCENTQLKVCLSSQKDFFTNIKQCDKNHSHDGFAKYQSKSEGKIKNNYCEERSLQNYYQLLCLKSRKKSFSNDSKDFRRIHKAFSPHFQRIHRSSSDTYLIINK